jgi:GAF domain-containing protein
MLEQVRSFFRAPVFPQDEDKTRKARYTNAIAISFLWVVVFYETFVRILVRYFGISIMDLILVGLAIFCITSIILLKKGYVQFTSVLFVVLVWIAANGIAATGFGVKDASYILNFAIILMAGLLLSWPAAVVVTVLSVVSGLALAYAEQNGLIEVVFYPVVSFARDIAFVFGLNGVLILLLITGLESALRRSRSNLKELESANKTLNFTQSELQIRTTDLVTANSQLENRTRKLHAVAEITRTATTLREFDQLLSSIPTIISNQLGYEHVTIFLLDEQRQYAILRAANTEAGLKMLSQGHRLPIGQLGIISAVAQTGQPRIRLNVESSNVIIQDFALGVTQSELAFPLKSGDEIIGVLDIQSTTLGEFVEDDVSTLSILADQVGIALQNSLLFEESQRALREANTESIQLGRRAWKGYADEMPINGYRYDGIKSEPLKGNKTLNQENGTLLIPVQLRGQTIGRLKLNPSERTHTWTDDELQMVKATAERVALALESARLLDEAQKRASREAFLSEIATKLSASFQLDSILRDTVHELGQTFENSTVTFQLVNPTELSNASEAQKANGASRE